MSQRESDQRFVQSLLEGPGSAAEAEPEEATETEDEEEERVEVEASDSSPTLTKQNIWGHHDTHPLLLLTALTDHYGPQWLDWEPETVRDSIRDDFGDPVITALNWNKIQAVRTCAIVDSPWKKWGVFSVINAPLNNNLPDFRMLHKPTIAQITVSIDIMTMIADHVLSEEVEQFIAACFLDDGVFYLPPPLDKAQEWASRLVYRCTKCGKIDVDQDNDHCDSCGAPDSDLVREYNRDHRPVEKRYKEVLDQPKLIAKLKEDATDVQVAKLLVAERYREFRRDLLEQQLEVMGHA